MKLSNEHKKLILEEFDFAVRKMKESQTQDLKLFYFSSTYGALTRIFNIKFDPELVFIHAVLNNAYTSMLGRFQAIRAGEVTISFPTDYFDKLTDYTEELADKIRKDSSLYDTLIKISLLTFVTTGNGAYLLAKGSIKL
jgi:hypothetical protein